MFSFEFEFQTMISKAFVNPKIIRNITQLEIIKSQKKVRELFGPLLALDFQDVFDNF